MAITVDVQPAYAQANSSAVTTASFTPTAGSLLVVCVGIANGNGIAGSGSSAITDTGSHSWTLLKRQANSGNSTSEVWVSDNAATSAITVTATSQISTQIDVCIQVISYNGALAKASQTGAIGGANASTVSITTTTAGSQVVGGFGFISPGALTANANTTIFGQTQGTAGDTEATWKATSLTGTPGATSFGFTNTTNAAMAIAGAEILPAATFTDPGPDPYETVGYPPGLNFYTRPSPQPWTGTGLGPTDVVAYSGGYANSGGYGNGYYDFGNYGSDGTPAVTGTANSGTATVAPNAGNASATGVANDATILAVSAPNISLTLSAPGLYQSPGLQNPQSWAGTDYVQVVNVSATEATGTGTANDATVTVAPNAENALGTEFINTAPIKLHITLASSDVTGTANSPIATVAPNAANAAGTGTANDATASLAVNAAAATATGTANDATVSTPVAVDASITFIAPGFMQMPFRQAWAGSGSSDVVVYSGGYANSNGGYGEGYYDFGNYGSDGTPTGIGTANDAVVKVAPNASAATGTGAANSPLATVTPNGASATGTGTANNAKAALTVNAGTATATGTANNATVSNGGGLAVNAECAIGNGAAFDARIPTVQFVQSGSGTSAAASTSITVTLGAAPTAGNLLIFAMGGDKNTGLMTLPGFTEVYTLNSTSVSLYYWYKVSDGTETSITATWANGSSSGNNAWLGEYKDDSVSGGLWRIAGQASNITNEVTTNSWGTGTTGIISNNGLAIAVAAIDSSQSITTRNAWGNGYTARFDTATASGKGSPYVAELPVSYNATTSSTFNYTGTADQVSGAVAVWFKTSEPHWDFISPGLYQSPGIQNAQSWAGSDSQVAPGAVSVNAQTAQATGTAIQPPIAGSVANAGNAAVVGASQDPTVTVKVNAATATATGTVNNGNANVKPNAVSAAIAGTAFNRVKNFVYQDFTSSAKPIAYSTTVKVITRTSGIKVDGN